MLYIKFKLYGGSRVREKFLLGGTVHFGDVRTFQHLYTTQRPSLDNEQKKKKTSSNVYCYNYFFYARGRFFSR